MGEEVKFHMWASQVALVSAYCLILGGIPTYFYPGGTAVAAYCWIIGPLLVPLMWPVRALGPLLGLFHVQFFVSAGILVSLSIYTFFAVPTVLGGIGLLCASLMYIIAGIRQEKGETCESLQAPPKPARGGD